MEVKNGDQHMIRVCICELIGTATLLYAINMSAGSDYQPFAIGLTIAAAIHQFDAITGGHFNPAVTIAVLIREGKMGNIVFALMIIISQILGGTIGCAAVWGSNPKHDSNYLAH